MMTRLDRLWPLRASMLARPPSRDAIGAFRNRQLRALIAHAYERVPYYRELLDRTGVKPEDVRTVADLSAIPITSKKELQSLRESHVVARGTDPRRLLIHRTSGSTGEPSTIRRSIFEETLLGFFQRRALSYFGVRMFDRRARILLVPPKEAQGASFGVRVFRRLSNLRTIMIHCLLEPDEIVRALRQTRPHIIIGVSGVMARVAEAMDGGDRRVIAPRLVLLGSEVLTSLMRRQIHGGFGAPIFDMYFSREFTLIGWECRETGELHTCDDGLIVEVLKDGRPAAPGEAGELIGTSLHSFSMPFIRYRLGDIVTNGSPLCVCGEPFATIREIRGRTVEFFELPDGRMLHPWEIMLLFRDQARWIQQYQLVQERRNCVVLRAVGKYAPSARDLAFLTESVGALLGPQVEFSVELLPEIRPGPTGKVRVFQAFTEVGDSSTPRTTGRAVP